MKEQADSRVINKYFAFRRVRKRLEDEVMERAREEAKVAAEAEAGLRAAKNDPALRAHLG